MKNLISNTRLHDIVFHKDGRIEIMARVARLLGLQKGDAINICFDGYQHYLYIYLKADKLVGRHKCRCFPSKNGSRNFRLNSLSLTRQMLSLCGSPCKASFPCGNPVTIDGSLYLPIITRLNYNCND